MKKTIISLIIVILFSLKIFGQTDTAFWFSAPEVSTSTSNFDIPIVFRISTSNLASIVTVSQPANSLFTPITVTIPANSTSSVDISAFLNMVETKPPNTIVNYGLHISASQPVTAYYEVVSSYCGCNPEIYSLKGKNALGTYFLIPAQTYYSNNPSYNPVPYSSFNIVATENGTNVTITPSFNIVGRPAAVPFTISLNAGQAYSATATSQSAGQHLQGSIVNSNKPIAITYSDDLLSGPGGCADLAGDQIVPVSIVGSEYIVAKGGLNIERVSVLGTQNNTNIFLDGNPTPVANIGLGQTYEFTLTNPSVYINASAPVYVLHTSGNGCEIGAALLPSIICTGSQQVGFTRSSSVPFYLNLVVRTASTGFFQLNGNGTYVTSGMFSLVPGTGGQWSFAHILFNTTQVPINLASLIRLTNGDVFHMGILNGDVGGGCSYGYFSDFNIINANAGADDTICLGQSINLNASGGTIYSWSPSEGLSATNISNPIASPTSTTTYTVTVTDINSCSATDNIVITVNPLPAANAGLDVAICNGNSTTLNASGGNTYSWSPSTNLSDPYISNPNASPPSTTTYTVTVSDLNNCSATDDVIITLLNPTPIDAGTNVAICAGSNTQLNAIGGLIYSWFPASGLSNTAINNPIASPSVTTTYYVSSSVPVGNLINNGNFESGNSGFNSNYTYMFPNSSEGQYYIGANPSSFNGLFSSCSDHTGGTNGNMMIVNGSGIPSRNVWCQTISITANTDYDFSTWATSLYSESPAILQFSINGQVLGSPFNLSSSTCIWSHFFATWNSGSNTTANICIVNQNTALGGNDFALDDISFSTLCFSTDSVLVTVNQLPTINAGSDVTICNGNNTQLNASGGNAYQWSPSEGLSTTDISNPLANPAITTTYIVTVTDVNNCSATDDVAITVNPLPTANAGSDVAICIGNNTQLSATGGTTYSWSPSLGLSETTISNPVANPTITTTYIVTITDVNNCSATDDVVITVNQLPAANAGSDVAICYSNNTQLNASGGNTYQWSPATNLSDPYISNPNASPLSTTTYTVTVSDLNNCSATDDMILTVHPQVIPDAGQDQAICIGQGVVSMNATGGANYAWSPSTGLTNINTANPFASPLTTTIYTVTVSDIYGCSETDNVTITVNPIPSCTYITDSANCNDSDGSITLTPSGGSTPYSYIWNPSVSTTAIAANIPAGTYYVTITDKNGCATTSTILVGETQIPLATASSQNEICGQANGSVDVTASGGLGPYNYLWNNNDTTSTISNLTAGNYIVTVTDYNGCTTSASVNVMETLGPDANFSVHPNVLTTMDGPVSFIDNSSGNIVSWQWDFGDGSTNGIGEELNHKFENVGTYLVTLIVTDSNGCVDTVTNTVKVKDIFAFYVPNAFTPNNDGINDEWVPKFVGVDINNYECLIFDRFGNLIFTTDNPYVPWNGTKFNEGNFKDVLMDVFVYKISLKEIDGHNHYYIGRITLIP